MLIIEYNIRKKNSSKPYTAGLKGALKENL